MVNPIGSKAVYGTLAVGIVLAGLTALFANMPQLVDAKSALNGVSLTTFSWSIIFLSLSLYFYATKNEMRETAGLANSLAYLVLGICGSAITYYFTQSLFYTSMNIPLLATGLIGLMRTLIMERKCHVQVTEEFI